MEQVQGLIFSVAPKELEDIILGNKTMLLCKHDPVKPFQEIYLYQAKDPSYKYKVLKNLKDSQGKVVGKVQYAGSVKMCSEFWNEPDTYEAIEVYCEMEDLEDDLVTFKLWTSECDYPELMYLETKLAKSTCTTLKDLKDWLGTDLHDFYGLYIKNPELLKKPSELHEFLKPCICPEMPYCPACKYGYEYIPEEEAEFYRMGEGADTEWYCHNVVKNPPAPLIYCVYNPEGRV